MPYPQLLDHRPCLIPKPFAPGPDIDPGFGKAGNRRRKNQVTGSHTGAAHDGKWRRRAAPQEPGPRLTQLLARFPGAIGIEVVRERKIDCPGNMSGNRVDGFCLAIESRPARLWWMLRWFGHSQVAVLNGGLKAWIDGDGTLATEVPEYTEDTLLEAPDCGRIITTDEIYSMLGKSDEMRLVDARDRARFNGQTEPIDPVAGHVPGAINFPFSDNLNADGTWKSSQELRQAWAGLLGSGTPPPFSVMCGSGVTACHLVLSAAIAGLAEPRVYIGSWSEWLLDAARPVA